MIIYFTYPTRTTTNAGPPGLGDWLRGSIALAHHALHRGFELRLDLSGHPLQSFIRPTNAAPAGLGEVAEFFGPRATLVYDWLDEALAKGQGGRVVTNLLPHAARIDAGVQRLMLEQFALTDEVESAARAQHARISDGEFAAVHVRVKDTGFQDDDQERHQLMAYLEKEVLPRWGKRIAIVSNSAFAKQTICQRFGLPLLETRAVHLGMGDGASTAVRDTLVDFALLARATRIHSFSEYGWSSGFSYWCAALHGIAFEPIVLQSTGMRSVLRDRLAAWRDHAARLAGSHGGASDAVAPPGGIEPVGGAGDLANLGSVSGGRGCDVFSAAVSAWHEEGALGLGPRPKARAVYRALPYRRLAAPVQQASRRGLQDPALCQRLRQRLRYDPATTIAVVLRRAAFPAGTPVAQCLALAQRLLLRNPGFRVWIESEEDEVRKLFLRTFGERCFHVDDDARDDRSLLAVASLISEAAVVINHTGPMGLWINLLRGSGRGVWQVDGAGGVISPVWPIWWWQAARRLVSKGSQRPGRREPVG